MRYTNSKSPVPVSSLFHIGVLLVMVAFAFPANAVAGRPPLQGGFTIVGNVSLADGKPAARVKVKLTSMKGLNVEVLTDDQGRYQFFNIASGRYQLTAVNPIDPTYASDATEADTSRTAGNRLIVHLFMRLPMALKPDVKPGIVSVAEATQRVPKEAKKAYDQGLKLKAEKQLDRAIESFGRALQLYPEYFQAFASRGETHIAQNRSAEAAEDFEQSLKLNEEYGPALRGAGYCKLEQQQFAEAIPYLDRAVTVDPRDVDAHLFLGIANLSLDRREAAGRALQQALKRDGERAVTAHVYLADLYTRQQQYVAAADELRAYLKARPNAPNAAKLKATEAELRSRSKSN